MVYQVLLPLLPLMRTSRLPVVDWTGPPPLPGQFKWTRPLRWRTKSGFCACAVTFQTCSTMETHLDMFREIHGLPTSATTTEPSTLQRRQSPLHCNEDRALYIATKTEPSTLQRRQSPLHCNEDRALYIATTTEPSTLQRRQSPLHWLVSNRRCIVSHTPAGNAWTVIHRRRN